MGDGCLKYRFQKLRLRQIVHFFHVDKRFAWCLTCWELICSLFGTRFQGLIDVFELTIFPCWRVEKGASSWVPQGWQTRSRWSNHTRALTACFGYSICLYSTVSAAECVKFSCSFLVKHAIYSKCEFFAEPKLT